jgi:hypothetical protein
MGKNGYRTVSGVIFAVIALLQALRAAMQVPVQIGATAIPVGISWVAFVVAGSLALWAFRSGGGSA